MEKCWQLDVAGRSSIREPIIRAVGGVCLLLAVALPGYTQSSPADRPQDSDKIKKLFDDERWEDVVREAHAAPSRGPDLDYYEGSALAHLERWDDAEKILLAGSHVAPRDKRFPIELAGIAFKKRNLPAAAARLRLGLRLDPADPYANDFLGTVYFLEGNLEAALKYWNRIRKPQIESMQPDAALRVRRALLDRALAFSLASELQLHQLLTSLTRIQGLEIFGSPRFQLAARPDGKFDVILNPQERNGWGGNRWEALVSTFRGVAYQTIYPAYFNLGRSAINITSLVRWDSQKRRLQGSLAGPPRQNPKWRYRIGFDLRNENWDIRNSLANGATGVPGSATVLAALNLRREAASAEITSFNSGRWGWSTGMEFSHRDYRGVVPGSTLTPAVLLAGNQLKQLANIHYDLWRVPERRFTVNTSATEELGRIWSEPAHIFAKLQGSAVAHWLPKSEGDDYEMRLQFRGGGIAGDVPFDELYMLGMERDNDLWMRAHVGTHDGRKGSAPLGQRYFLENAEFDKNIYSNGLITVNASPFLDSGKITDSSDSLGSRKWLWDTGVQAKVRVLGVGVVFVYGKDLRNGNNVFYFSAAR
jgi:tetratricopeptide (TPR) repeat protein